MRVNRVRSRAAQRPKSPSRGGHFRELLDALSRYSQRILWRAPLIAMVERERNAFREHFPQKVPRPEVEFLCAKLLHEARIGHLRAQSKPTAEQWHEFVRSPESRELHAKARAEFMAIADAFPESREAGLSLAWAIHTQRIAEPDDLPSVKANYDRLMARWKRDQEVMEQALALTLDVKHVLEGAPEFSVTDLDGNDLSPEQYRGRVLLLHFWATWCGPCLGVISALKQLRDRFGDRGPLDEFKEWLDREGVSWPQHYGGQGLRSELARLYDIRHIPYALLIDRDGKAVWGGSVTGAMTEEVEELMAEGVPPEKE
jgi:thiol-disulfide isomerase/thioredoxin